MSYRKALFSNNNKLLLKIDKYILTIVILGGILSGKEKTGYEVAYGKKNGFTDKKEKPDHVDKISVGFHVLFWDCGHADPAFQH